MIPVGHGQPNQTCITAGPNGRLDTTPAGDDKKQGNTINTGANGYCETAVVGDDVQVIAVGNGQPNTICVTPGRNKFRDTAPFGDDAVAGDNITTGPNGICDTIADASNVAPQSVPTTTSLQTYLNSVFGAQANISFTITRSDKTVNYDLDRDGALLVGQLQGQPSAEQQAILNAVQDNTVFANVYYVHRLSTFVGVSDPMLHIAFVQDDRSGDSGENITAHEIGHILGLGHPEDGYCVEPGEDITTRLMTTSYSNLNPCRLNKCEWDAVNP